MQDLVALSNFRSDSLLLFRWIPEQQRLEQIAQIKTEARPAGGVFSADRRSIALTHWEAGSVGVYALQHENGSYRFNHLFSKKLDTGKPHWISMQEDVLTVTHESDDVTLTRLKIKSATDLELLGTSRFGKNLPWQKRDGKSKVLFLVSRATHEVIVVDSESNSQISALKLPDFEPYGLEIDAEAKLIAVSSIATGQVVTISYEDVRNMRQVGSFEGPKGGLLRSLHRSTDGLLLVGANSGTSSLTLFRKNGSQWTYAATLPTSPQPRDAIFLGSSHFVATSVESGVEVYDVDQPAKGAVQKLPAGDLPLFFMRDP